MEIMNVAFLVIFLILLLALFVWRDRKTWQLCELCVVAILGALFLVPSYFFKYVGLVKEGQSDDTLVWLSRLVSILLLCHALLLYLNMNSVDVYTQVILLYPGVVTGCLVFMVYFVEYPVALASKTSEKTENSAQEDQRRVGLLFTAYWLFANLFFVVTTHYYGRSQLYSRLNSHLRLDFFLALMFGLLLFAYPEFVLKSCTTLEAPSVVHTTAVRWVAALLISSAIVSVHAPSFLMENDKRNVLLVKLVSSIAVILVILYLQIATKLVAQKVQWAVLLTAFSTINAALGFYAPHETDRYKAKE